MKPRGKPSGTAIASAFELPSIWLLLGPAIAQPTRELIRSPRCSAIRTTVQPAKSGACEVAPWHNQIRNGRDARVLGQVLHFGSSTLGGLTLEFRQIRY